MKLIIAWLCLFICTTTFALSPKQIQILTQKYTPHAFVGISVMDAKTGKTLYAQNADKAFSPASNLKLFTALAALYALGPDYRFSTDILINPHQLYRKTLNGNLTIKFRGDPSLKIKQFDQMIRSLSTKIHIIRGNIILDNTRFQRPFHPLGTIREDTNWYFDAPASTIILDRNTITIDLIPSNRMGKLAKIRRKKNAKYISISGQVTTVSRQQADHHCRLLIDISNRNYIHLNGCWPIRGYSSELNIAIKNPAAFATKIIQSKLKRYRVQLKGKIIAGKSPKTLLKRIIIHRSPTLSLLLHTMMKNSNNLYARMIARVLGEKYFGRGTIQEGANAIKLILKKHANVDLKQTRMFDAAGTHYTLVTPRQIVLLLYAAYHSPFQKIFIKNLPKSGNHGDGTLYNILTYRKLPKHIFAKTGSIKGNSALSGYFLRRHRPLIFTILVNHIIGKNRKAQRLQVVLCRKFFNRL